MLFNRNRKIDEMKNKSYPKTDSNRINFICSLPYNNGEILNELANITTNGNKSLLLKLIVYNFFEENSIDFAKEI